MYGPKEAYGYQDGKTYFCWYWQQQHKVRVIAKDGYDWIESTWSDGRKTIHCTERDSKRDYEIETCPSATKNQPTPSPASTRIRASTGPLCMQCHNEEFGEEEKTMKVRLTRSNSDDSRDPMIDPATIKITGQAEPTSRLLDGSSDHGFIEEWAEPGILPDGRRVDVMYLFDEDDVVDDEGNVIAAEDYPWDHNHIRRVVIRD